MPHTALRRHSPNVKSKTRASGITVMSRAVVRWERRENERHDTSPITAKVISGRWVVYLSPADKYHRLTRRLSQGQKDLEERALRSS
jgi:hypothetical protein